MRCLNKNKMRFYFALYDTKNPVFDEYGNETGQYTVTYRNPQVSSGNISAVKGETGTLPFGEDEDYDRVVVLDDPLTPINEYSVLWVGTEPLLTKKGALKTDEDGNILTPWNYVVKKVAPSLNSVTIAISKVEVNG